MAKLWWLSLIRGLAALLLGVALVMAPGQGKPLMAQYMGMYWMASGVLSIVWGIRGARFTRLWLLADSVGLFGGLFIVAHMLFTFPVETALAVDLFGMVAFLTGVLHMLGGFRIQREHGPRWSRGSFLLGLVQMILGVLILVSPDEVPPVVVGVAMIWALVGGLGLVRDALRLRKFHKSTLMTS
jgi:uncharacterized membrane protein HdeD (DUF308 family)